MGTHEALPGLQYNSINQINQSTVYCMPRFQSRRIQAFYSTSHPSHSVPCFVFPFNKLPDHGSHPQPRLYFRYVISPGYTTIRFAAFHPGYNDGSKCVVVLEVPVRFHRGGWFRVPCHGFNGIRVVVKNSFVYKRIRGLRRNCVPSTCLTQSRDP